MRQIVPDAIYIGPWPFFVVVHLRKKCLDDRESTTTIGIRLVSHRTDLHFFSVGDWGNWYDLYPKNKRTQLLQGRTRYLVHMYGSKCTYKQKLVEK